MAMVPDRRDGARRDHDALEEIEVDAQRVSNRRLDRIGMRDGDHGGAGMAFDDPGQRRDDARLHLDKRLAAREAKPARMTLYGLPLGLAGELPELLTRPLADVAVGQVALDAHRDAVRARDRQRG